MDGAFCGDCGADSRGACTCANETEECPGCGGDGFIEEDRFTPGRGHYTVEVQCSTCEGAGRVNDEGPDWRDPADAPPPTEDTTGLKDPPL